MKDIFKNKRMIADGTLLLVAFIWGAGIPMSAHLARVISPLWAVSLRMGFAGIALFLLYPRKVVTSTKGIWMGSLWLALIISAVFALMTFGLKLSTASKQAFLIGNSVIIVPFLVWAVYRKRPQTCVFLGAALSTFGLLVMGFTPGMTFNFGDFLSAVMVFIAAGQILVISHYAKKMDTKTLVANHIILAGVILTLAAFLFEPIPDFASFSGFIWFEILTVSLLNTVLCFLLQFRAQRHTSEAHAAVILSTESLFGYFVAVFSGQDPFHLQGAVGGLFIFIGVLMAEADILIKKRDIPHSSA
ncbi:MAG: DMT family transporter [Synergistaceae bacterium]|nr:DMT family transporter [Synergistaceae bacterium]